MNKWQILHAHRRACLDGKASFVMCPDDGNELYPTVDKSGDPALRCFTCRSVFVPGTDVYEQMEKELALLS